VLENIQEQTELANGLELGKIRGMTNISRRKLKNEDHKVILIGDSHARECAEKISNYLGNSYEVTGYVNPGTGLEVITNSAKKEIDRLTQKDVVIVCGGANNVSKNELIKGLKCLTQFMQNRRNTIAGGCEVKGKGEKLVRIGDNLNVIHQNIGSLWGKYGEWEILLETEINNVEVLCFTEHWLNCYKIHAININNFTSASAFCRKNSDHGGSCIFIYKKRML
jgi:hypothetical protein